MTTGGGGSLGAFTAFFNAEGNAAETFERIRSNIVNLNQDALNLSRSLGPLGNRIGTVSQQLLQSGDVRGARRLEAVGNALMEMGRTGQFTASQLERVSRTLTIVGSRAAPEVSSRIEVLTTEVEQMTAQMRVAEQQARRTSQGMSFMADVSQNTAQNFRRVSAASQGLLLGLSALEGNATNLAFSLIFLQFSGFLRISLAVAGVTLASKLLFGQFQKLFQQRRDFEKMADTIFIFTGAAEGFALLREQILKTVDTLGLAAGKGDELRDALLQMSTLLTTLNYAPDEENLRIFTELFLIAQGMGQTTEDAFNASRDALVSFLEAGGTGLIDFLGRERSLEEITENAVRALFDLQGGGKDVKVTLDELRKAFLDAGFSIEEVDFILADAGKAFLGMENGVIRLGTVLGQLPFVVREKLQGEFVPTVESAAEDLDDAFRNIAKSGEENLAPRGVALIIDNLDAKLFEMMRQGNLTQEVMDAEFAAMEEKTGVSAGLMETHFQGLIDLLLVLQAVAIETQVEVSKAAFPGQVPFALPPGFDPFAGGAFPITFPGQDGSAQRVASIITIDIHDNFLRGQEDMEALAEIILQHLLLSNNIHFGPTFVP